MDAYQGTERPLRIAIVGGGIGGLTLLLGILNHCDRRAIEPHLYEATSAFSEIGAGVGLTPNAVRSMNVIDPRLQEAYQRVAMRASTVKIGGRKVSTFLECLMGMDGRGESNKLKTFDTISVVHNENEHPSIHRAILLDEMVKLLPTRLGAGLCSFNKRCTDVQENDDGVTIFFADGTSSLHDAVIGCDGVKSRVRKVLLGDGTANIPRFTGKYAYRGLVPMDDAIAAIGEKARGQLLLAGYGGHLITFPVEQGKTLNIVAFHGAHEWNHGGDWVVPSTIQDALDDFKDFSEPVKQLLSLLEKPDKWALFEQQPAKSYVKQGVFCLLGDCAHASTPHLGSGAGMAIEDSAVLSRLLAEIKKPDRQRLVSAFAAYDAVRRQRTQTLVKSSRTAGRIYDFEQPGIGDDPVKLRDTLLTQWDWIWDIDIEAHCTEAIDLMNHPKLLNSLV